MSRKTAIMEVIIRKKNIIEKTLLDQIDNEDVIVNDYYSMI